MEQQAQEPQQPATPPTFEYTPAKGKKATYRVLGSRWNIPGKGEMDAADIATDEAAQKYLVEDAKAIGTVLEVVA